MSIEFDRHHVLHDSRAWRQRVSSRMLRATPSLIPNISRDLHEHIHNTTPPVPVPSYHVLDETLNLFVPTGNFFADIDGLCHSIDRASNKSRGHRIERELAGLTIETLQLQKNEIKNYGLRSVE